MCAPMTGVLRKLVHQVRDSEGSDRLMVLSPIDCHLNDLICVTDNIIATVRVIRQNPVEEIESRDVIDAE